MTAFLRVIKLQYDVSIKFYVLPLRNYVRPHQSCQGDLQSLLALFRRNVNYLRYAFPIFFGKKSSKPIGFCIFTRGVFLNASRSTSKFSLLFQRRSSYSLWRFDLVSIYGLTTQIDRTRQGSLFTQLAATCLKSNAWVGKARVNRSGSRKWFYLSRSGAEN